MVDVADVKGGPAIAAESELERAGLDEVLFFGSPNERVLLDVEATVFGSGEGEAKLATSVITVKIFSTMADGDICSLDATYVNMVGVDITIDMKVDVGEIERLVEVLGGEGLFRTVGGLVTALAVDHNY